MGKTPRKHFDINEWKVTESEFGEKFSRVAESVFSLGNEFMGARGFLDEGSSSPSLIGTYINGIYEYAIDKAATGYKGIATRTHYMVNSVNFFGIKIAVDGVMLDMASTPYTDYSRTLDLKRGKLFRSLVWQIGGNKIKTEFCRFLDMEHCGRAYQEVTLYADKPCSVTLEASLSFDEKHFGNPSRWIVTDREQGAIECSTDSTNQRVACAMHCEIAGVTPVSENINKGVKKTFTFEVDGKGGRTFRRLISVATDKGGNGCLEKAKEELYEQHKEGYAKAYQRNDEYWGDFWNKSDIEIEGDPQNQQGIRFCIFQLQQTYHGAKEGSNIGAKGLTGEAYSGHAFWDTETYCLPYYLFNNLQAAKNLLEFRYGTLGEAKKRARDLDCEGACYPIATLNGEEACTLWQHASLQMQPSTAVAYGIYHYVNVSGDKEFLYSHGVEMLVEICRYLVTRGQWDATNSYFGYYCVMGPDEFQMMVNHNTYTNYMAKKTLTYTLDVLGELPKERLEELSVSEEEIKNFALCGEKMLILYDEKTKLYEQHDGYFKLPHIDIHSIPDEQFPLYHSWSYDRIYRNDMIKQPDVLMFQLLYNSDFTLEQKRANYMFYEPRCIHESSLSPSVHSILAAEIGEYRQAYDFFAFATRMDIDDYNRNTHEGLHTTSISAAWLNIVYGFAGLRSDGEISLNPICPEAWKSYSFKITVNGALLSIKVDKNGVNIRNNSQKAVKLIVYGEEYTILDKLEIKK